MRLHVDQSEGLLKEDNEHAAGNTVLIKAVFVHVRLLRKDERRVFKACTSAQIRLHSAEATTAASGPSLASLVRQTSLRVIGRVLPVWQNVSLLT